MPDGEMGWPVAEGETGGSSAKVSHNDFLDLARGLAAQLVLFGHAAGQAWLSLFMAGTLGSYRPIPGVFYAEDFGVLIFFLLSGYLIAGTAARKQGTDAFALFMAERAGRIYTVLIPALVFTALFDGVLSRHVPGYNWAARLTVPSFLANMLMLFDNAYLHLAAMLSPHLSIPAFKSFGSNGPLWTLVIEWWLYVSWGIAMILWRDKRLGVASVLLFLFAVSSPAKNFILGNAIVLSWLLGAGFYFLHQTLRRRGWNFPRWIVIPAALFCIGAFVMVRSDVNRPAFQVAFAVLFFTVFAAGLSLPAIVRVAGRGLAAYSYSLYLVHYPLVRYFGNVFPDRPWACFFLSIASANLLAVLFWWAFERHYPRVTAALRRCVTGRGGRTRRASATTVE